MVSNELKKILPEYIKARIIGDYDLTPQAREKHDRVIAKKYKKEYYLHEEIARAWRESKSRRVDKKIGLKDKVANPWIV